MNPEILPVLDEISAVLKKHDMMGLVIVGNPSHCDWRMEVEASWSCARFEEQPDGKGVGIRVRSKRVDFASKWEQKRCLERTIGTFVTFQHWLKKMDEQLDPLLLAISKQVDFLGKSTDES